ncbi:unnamed protein product [Vicia faba]|uniref:Uncharacterized protein n=1 Tax=Vicia faba TaxID=3906 RepID=A0AAV1ADI5_VICFA|nr:unnamed protein product [Vicia faba]
MSNSLPVEIYGSELDSNCEKEELNSDCDGDFLIRMENRSTPLVVRGEPGGEWEKAFSSPSFHSYLVPRIPSPLRTTTQDCWITHQCHQLKIMALGKPMLTWLTLTPRGKGFFMAFPAYENILFPRKANSIGIISLADAIESAAVGLGGRDIRPTVAV